MFLKSKLVIILIAIVCITGCTSDTPHSRATSKPEDFFVSQVILNKHEYNVFKVQKGDKFAGWETIGVEHSKECKECYQ